MSMNTEQPSPPSIMTPLLGWGATVLILAGVWFAAPVVNMVLVAGLLTLLCVPIRGWLERRGLPRWLALTLIILGVFLLFLLVLGLVGLSVAQIIDQRPAYEAQLVTRNDALFNALAERGVDISAFTATAQKGVSRLFGVVAGLAVDLTRLLANSAFILLIFAYLLADADGLVRRLRRVVPAGNPLLKRAGEATSSVATYMLILTIVNLVVAVLDVIFLQLIGIPNALLWGVLAFLFGYIPYVGYWVSILPPLVLGFIEGGMTLALVIILGYWFINGVISSVVAPRFFGKGLNLSAVVTLVAIFFWGFLLGPIGSILGVPLTALIKSVVLESYSETQWLAAALSMDEPSQGEGRTSV